MPSLTARRARQDRPCTMYPCSRIIPAGGLYLRFVSFPGDEGHEEGTRPWVISLCPSCADISGDYIRHRYGVVYAVGDEVATPGGPGVIVGSQDERLLVRVCGRIGIYHPWLLIRQAAKV